jgi:HEPN domain-containing protein
MKSLTLEWIEKAEGDFISAQREFRAKKLPNYDAACFHAQQCAEKYLKSRLQEADIPFGKSHDLTLLLDLLLPVEPLWDSFRPQLRILNVFAIEFRYPGQSADKEIARQAIIICKNLRETVRIGFGLTG